VEAFRQQEVKDKGSKKREEQLEIRLEMSTMLEELTKKDEQ